MMLAELLHAARCANTHRGEIKQSGQFNFLDLFLWLTVTLEWTQVTHCHGSPVDPVPQSLKAELHY